MSKSELKDRLALIGTALLAMVAPFVFAYIQSELQQDDEKKIRDWDWKPTFDVDQQASERTATRRSRNSPRRPEPWRISVDRNLPSHRKVTTERYWKIAVADLHDLRFGEATENEPPFRELRNFQTKFQARQERIKALSTAGVDQDLVKMVKKHLKIDAEIVDLLTQMRQVAANAGIPEDYVPSQEQVENGLNLLAEVNSDPLVLEKMDPKVRKHSQFIRAAANFYEHHLEWAVEQYHDIELMQARMQGRYPEGDFSLPHLAEVEE